MPQPLRPRGVLARVGASDSIDSLEAFQKDLVARCRAAEKTPDGQLQCDLLDPSNPEKVIAACYTLAKGDAETVKACDSLKKQLGELETTKASGGSSGGGGDTGFLLAGLAVLVGGFFLLRK